MPFGSKTYYKHKSWSDKSRIIKKWLNNFTKKSNNIGACIIVGGIGVGKTSLVMNILNKKDYDVILLTPNTMPTKKDVETFFHDNIMTNNLQDLFLEKKRNKAIVIDEIENISFKFCPFNFLVTTPIHLT